MLTRFGLRRPWHLFQTYIAYRWLLRKVRRQPSAGFLHATFLVENLMTCYSLSMWADETAIAMFGTSAAEHVDVARGVFRRLRFSGGMPEIWSTKWQLRSVSHNVNWNGFDIRAVVVQQDGNRGP